MTRWRDGNNSRQEGKREESSDARAMEHKFKNPSSSTVSLGFFRNIKKHLRIRNLCETKQKEKEVEVANSPGTNANAVISASEALDSHHDAESLNNEEETLVVRRVLQENRLSATLEDSCHIGERNVDNIGVPQIDATALDPRIVPMNRQGEATSDVGVVNNTTATQPSCSEATAGVPSAIMEAPAGADESLSNNNKVKASLAKELLNLSKYGWYWGPISGEEADSKLISEPDGAFLVRDSSDAKYVLTLSFKSSGKVLHARMEHSGGLFSLCSQCRESEGFTSVAALINHSMNFSQSAVICYSRPKYPGYPSFPVRLTKPVSRFTQVRSLQYLCRFVIRQNTTLDNIHKLPLPKTIKGYIQEAHY